MEQSVETRLGKLGDKVDRHLVYLLGAFAAGFILLAGLVLNRTDDVRRDLDNKFTAISQQISGVQTDVAVLKARKP